MNEIISTEKDYVGKLTEKEHAVYLCDADMQAKLRASNDWHALNFLDKVTLLDALHRQHTNYNNLYEKYCSAVPPSEVECDIDELLIGSMQMTIAIDTRAIVVDLTIMDDCDAVYGLLATFKMHAFDLLVDNFDLDTLF